MNLGKKNTRMEHSYKRGLGCWIVCVKEGARGCGADVTVDGIQDAALESKCCHNQQIMS